MALLKLENVSVSYGKIKALDNINLEIGEGRIVTLIGANGAGKSTAMRTVMGLKHCDGGKVWFDGLDITNKDTGYMVKQGIILSPEGRQIFPGFTVRDNLFMGAYLKTKEEAAETIDMVYELFPKLKAREKQTAGTLSGGEQQMLALGRAIMGRPRLLLLDEPSLGLAPLIILEIFEEIKKINEMGTTILLVEQNAKVALKVSDMAYVLETGKVVLHDTAQALLNSDKVQKAYFGGFAEG
ncbi:MAG: ABC transporter ATP-binding protein [Hungatella sp.]|jgi:branched-chain amino acid transport system ATP-binding protein|nr:ABC transporter ATP-binding protein [Hungatella sp.]